ncbi:hypothetical protein Rxycam_02402 [Rubrobacter xylanophilus DSM 9941]|uniref:J domain-containing protein n=1 Tax=Rubrobacter xylanophilus TaxID=49319 RepID=UPI001C640F2A|nr:J domain-containing protein [Rubrobacter xylanophilus]QYJ16568.1 hypothetical protein Rxycam_02402 [Rubrobacter xylanophilus DSM 9941]
MSIPRRLGRLARGFVLSLQEDERLRESLAGALRAGRERGETLRGAFEAAWRGTSEEWRSTGERHSPTDEAGWRRTSVTFRTMRYPPEVLEAYERLGLSPGAPIEEVDRRRRELVKKYHPDRFTDPAKRARAERVTAEINAAHDRIERHLLRRG